MLIIEPNDYDQWLTGDPQGVYDDLIKPLKDDLLAYHPCHPIKPNKRLNRIYIGNIPSISNPFRYAGLENNQTSLF